MKWPFAALLLHVSVVSMSVVAGPCFAAEPKTPFHWPGQIKAAVSLAYDDALNSQLDNAIPALNRYQLKASFYLIGASPVLADRLDEWRAAAAQGHELGNHTLFHQCSRSLPGHEWVTPEQDLETISVAQLKAQILLANTLLQAIDGKHERTFTAPCTEAMAGGENYLTAIQSHFVAIKATAGSGITPDMNTLDRYAVNVVAPSNVSGQELIAIVKEAARVGTMVNFTFHGIGADHLPVSKEAHEELLKFLAANRQTYWTDTFITIMSYVNRQRP